MTSLIKRIPAGKAFNNAFAVKCFRFLWFNLLILNLYQRGHIESWYIEQMCVIVKTGALIVLPIIHTENKRKKILGTIWGRKLDSKFSKVLCFYKLEIHKVSRFVKSLDWNLKFSSWLSQVSQIVLFKNEEKYWKERKKMKKWKM